MWEKQIKWGKIEKISYYQREREEKWKGKMKKGKNGERRKGEESKKGKKWNYKTLRFFFLNTAEWVYDPNLLCLSPW